MAPSDHPPSLPYSPPGPGRDELLDGDGAVRPAWRALDASLLAAGPDQLVRQAARIGRRLHSHGTTFQIHGEGSERWTLDPVPLVVDGLEWSQLGFALAQRALVVEAVLADLHGEQRLLRAGHLPAELVLTHPGLLPACRGIAPAGGRHLVTYAADVVHRADGSYTVLADRTDDPIGAGYALENRDALGAAFPGLLRPLGVRSVAGWYEKLRAALAAAAPAGVDDPRIVILGRGPEGEAAFEDGFLARTLGYTLVQGADLAVRGGRVHLKSMGGLEPVHVVYRRLPSGLADPLELRPETGVGVAGLVEATRRGTVSVVNPIGAGAGANPALLPHLAGLTRLLLGEEPLLEAVPTWWCGDPAGRSHVLANLDRLVVKPVDPRPGRGSVFGRTLSSTALDELRDRIRARPHRWVGQEELELPTAPSFDGSGLAPQRTVQRAFLVADEDGYAFLDGALTRAADRSDGLTVFTGGTAKDTWVVDGAEYRPRRPPPPLALPQVDLRSSVTSRTAEAMFWFGRNLERAEVVIRLVQAIDRMLDEMPDLRDEAGGAWPTVASTVLAELAGAAGPGEPPDGLDDLLHAALTERSRPRSVATSLHFLLEAARSVRELFSTESWRVLTGLGDQFDRLADAGPDESVETIAPVLTSLAAMSGLLTESMVRDPGWRFLDTGRRIERALLLGRALRATVVEAPPDGVAAAVYELVLLSWDSLVAYRRRYRSDIVPATLLDLLLDDGSNPRALAALLTRLADDLADLPDLDKRAPTAAGLVAAARAGLDRRPAAELARLGPGSRRPALATLLDEVAADLDRVADQLELGYFAHVRLAAVGAGIPLGRRRPG